MLDQFKAMGAIAGLMKDKERLHQLGQEFQRKLEGLSVRGAAGSGAVAVTITGKLVVTDVHIDPAVAAGFQHDQDMVQSLIAQATNDAITRMQALIAEQAKHFAEDNGLGDLPGIDRLAGMLGGGTP